MTASPVGRGWAGGPPVHSYSQSTVSSTPVNCSHLQSPTVDSYQPLLSYSAHTEEFDRARIALAEPSPELGVLGAAEFRVGAK